MTLKFQPQTGGQDFSPLPENYLPAALPYLAGQQNLPPLFLLAPEPKPGNSKPPEPVKIPAEDLADPARMLSHTESGREGFLLPNGELSQMTLSSFGPEVANGPVTALIDTGIAFWNPAFRLPDGGNRIKEIAFLGLAGESQSLSQEEFAPFYALADGPGGEARVIKALGQRFVGSLYEDGFKPGQFSHGTAMAGLLIEAEGAAPAPPPLFAVELPAIAVFDRSGASLQAVLLQAIKTCIQGFEGSGISHLNIVLPFAFLGGPHDRSHPGLDFLHQALERHKPGFEVKLFLPSGNHRQDRQHARFPALQSGSEQAITWRLHHGDHSSNSLDICYAAEDAPALELKAPDGSVAQLELTQGSYSKVMFGDRVIGGALLRSTAQNHHRLRLSFSAPASKDLTAPRVPAGDWQITLKAISGGVGEASLWILRDDSNLHLFGEDPVRPSEFVDPHHRERLSGGEIPMKDQDLSAIRQSGTASTLCASKHLRVVSVKALHQPHPGGSCRDSWYSGLPPPDGEDLQGELVDQGWTAPGLRLLGNGSAQRFRVSGSSFATALAARKAGIEQKQALAVAPST